MALASRRLGFDDLLGVLQEMLGQRVTVIIGPTPAPDRKVHIVATFSGELQRSQDIGDDAIAFVVGTERPAGYVVLRESTFESATTGGDFVGVIASDGVHIQVSGGRFTALLEEQ